MSRFSNLASRSVEGAHDYVQAVLELIGDREPLEILGSSVARVQELVAGLSPEQLRQPEAPGKWSIAEVVMHLADNEVVDAWRIRLILTSDQAQLHGYDQDRWHDRLRYREAPLDESLAQLAAVRATTLRLLRTLSEGELERTGLHAERGPETVRRQIGLLAGHDLIHLAQIERIRNSLG